MTISVAIQKAGDDWVVMISPVEAREVTDEQTLQQTTQALSEIDSDIVDRVVDEDTLILQMRNNDFTQIAPDVTKILKILFPETNVTHVQLDIRKTVTEIETGMLPWRYCLDEWSGSQKKQKTE